MEEKKSVGILNRGKNNTFKDNTFVGLAIGLQDEGEGTKASGNKFNYHKDNSSRWYDKWWMKRVALPVIVGLIVLIVTLIIT